MRSPKTRTARKPSAAVGVDVGLSHLATLSTGQAVPNAGPLRAALGKLARYQRQLATQRRLNNPSNYNADGTSKPGRCDWVVSARERRTQERIQRLHERVSSLRRQQAHGLATHLTREFGITGAESLAVANLMKNKRLARHIADVGWGTILQQLKYKTDWTEGSLLVAADRFYPSSKTCSGCGAVRAKLNLSERVFTLR